MAELVTVKSGGQPVPKVDLLALFPNQTWKSYQTDSDGKATLNLYSDDLSMTVFAAAPGYEGAIRINWIPAKEDLTIEMNPLPNGGSCIFNELRGYIPVLEGELEFVWLENVGKIGVLSDGVLMNGEKPPPIISTLSGKDSSVDRVYFDESEINPPPTQTAFNQNIELTDQNDISVLASVLDIIGKSVLIDWWKKG